MLDTGEHNCGVMIRRKGVGSSGYRWAAAAVGDGWAGVSVADLNDCRARAEHHLEK